MKKSKIILGLLLIAFIGVFFACEETENVGPTITIAVIGDETGWRGDTIKYLVTWSEGDKKIENLTITPSTAGANTSSTVDIEITSDITSYEYIYVISGQAVEGTISITFTIIDKNDEIDEEIKTIIIEEAINIFSYDVTLGSPRSGSSGTPCLDVDSQGGNAYSSANGLGNAAEIDIIFFNGVSNGYTLSSPTNTEDLDDFSDLDILNWSVLNETNLKTGVSMNFDGIELYESNKLEEAYTEATGNEVLKINLIESAGQIIAFKTADNKCGLIKSGTASPEFGDASTDATFTISVKVQQ